MKSLNRGWYKLQIESITGQGRCSILTGNDLAMPTNCLQCQPHQTLICSHFGSIGTLASVTSSWSCPSPLILWSCMVLWYVNIAKSRSVRTTHYRSDEPEGISVYDLLGRGYRGSPTPEIDMAYSSPYASSLCYRGQCLSKIVRRKDLGSLTSRPR